MSSISINRNAADSAARQLARSTHSLHQSLSRLSSGLRINKAADDAAGLAIADDLRVNARLTQAAGRNVNDGISALNIITGALDNQKQILFRMAELAEQAANGVNSSRQREALDDEYQELMLEFDRIAATAQFNGQSLLRSPNAESLGIMAGITGADSSLIALTKANSHRFAGVLAQRSDVTGNGQINTSDHGMIRGILATVSFSNSSSASTQRIHDFAEIQVVDSQGMTGIARVFIDRCIEDTGFTPVPVEPTGVHVDAYLIRENGERKELLGLALAVNDTTLNVSGAYDTSGAQVSFSLDISGIVYKGLDSTEPDIKQTAIGFTHLLYRDAAARALDTVCNRIDVLSELQGQYGALQARLATGASMLQTAAENFQAAESAIRDADVAQETAQLMQSRILQQAGTAVLAQAQRAPQLVLELLQTPK